MTSIDRLNQLYHILFMISEDITDFNNRYDKKSFTEKDLIEKICDRLDYRVEYQDFCDAFFALKDDLKVLGILKENAHLYVNDVNKDVKSIQINITTCDDNFNKVEEWLGNGK